MRGRIAVGYGERPAGRRHPAAVAVPAVSTSPDPCSTGSSCGRSASGRCWAAQCSAKVDADLEQFDLLPLLTVLAAPAELFAVLPDTARLRRTLVLDRVTAVIVPEVPLALPVLFEDLAVHHVGLEGIEAAAAPPGAAPEPERGRRPAAVPPARIVLHHGGRPAGCRRAAAGRARPPPRGGTGVPASSHPSSAVTCWATATPPPRSAGLRPSPVCSTA